MALYDDDMWNGRTTARLTENRAAPAPAAHHPLRAVTIGLGALGVALAPLSLRTDEFLALVLAGAFVGGGHSALLWTATHSSPAVSLHLVRRISASAGAGSVVAVAGGCLYPSIGVLGAVVVLSAIVSLPYLARRLTRGPRRSTEDLTPGPVQTFDLPAPPLARRSILEIAAAWHSSHELMRRTPSAHDRARIAGLRQEYLDELERRDAAGVTRWLRSGQALSSDIASYLAAHDRDEPEPDTP